MKIEGDGGGMADECAREKGLLLSLARSLSLSLCVHIHSIFIIRDTGPN